MFNRTSIDMKPLAISLAVVLFYFAILGMAFVGNGAAAIWGVVLALPAGLAGYACVAALAETHG
jgi:hypothetical protein